MKKFFFSLAILAACINAQASTPPAKCPSVNALQQSVFNDAEQDEEGVWEVDVMKNNYDTQDGWSFILRNIFANGRADAIKRATAALKHISFETGPVSSAGFWMCIYSTSEGYQGVTVTPPLVDSLHIGKNK